MKSEPAVLVVAPLNADHIVQASRITSPGETIMGHTLSRELGRKGGNQAIASARLGAPTAAIACVGADDDGDDYLAALRADGVNTRHVSQIADHATGRAAITVDDEGTNAIVVIAGANEAIPADTASRAFTDFEQLRVAVGQMEASVSATAAVFREALHRGIITVLNTAPATESVPELVPWSDIVVANEIEFQQITGQSSEDQKGLCRGAQTLFDEGVRWVIVTSGEKGSVVLDGTEIIRVPAERVTAVDTTAAGDAFVGAVAAHLAGTEIFHHGEKPVVEAGQPVTTTSIVRACEAASRVSAVVVTRRGAHPSLPTLDEVRAIF